MLVVVPVMEGGLGNASRAGAEQIDGWVREERKGWVAWKS